MILYRGIQYKIENSKKFSFFRHIKKLFLCLCFCHSLFSIIKIHYKRNSPSMMFRIAYSMSHYSNSNKLDIMSPPIGSQSHKFSDFFFGIISPEVSILIKLYYLCQTKKFLSMSAYFESKSSNMVNSSIKFFDTFWAIRVCETMTRKSTMSEKCVKKQIKTRN